LQGYLRSRRAKGKAVAADAEGGARGGCYWNGEQVAATLTRKGCDDRMPDKERMFAVLQPTAGTLGTRGLRSHTELDGHGAYIPVAQPVPFAIYGGNKRPDRPEGGFYVRQEDTARTLDSSQGLNPTCSQGGTGVLQPVPDDLFQITAPVNRQNRAPGDPCHTLAKDNAAHAAVAFQQNQLGEVRCGNIAGTVNTNSNASGRNTPMVAFHPTQDPISSTDGSSHCMGTGSSRGDATIAVAVAPSLTATNDPSRSPQSSEVTQQVAAVHAASMTVRRLTPRECERLQGFPDDWTLIPWRGKPAEQCPDGPRYKALGNSMACNCMAWIGERIAAYEEHNP
jgi:hypothetical protein